MTVYLIKLILILVFNAYVNIYYINCCKCCCCGNNTKSREAGSVSKTNLGTNPPNAVYVSKGGGKQVDKFEINLDNDTLKRNENILQWFEKIEDLPSTNPERVINGNFKNDQNIYYTID